MAWIAAIAAASAATSAGHTGQRRKPNKWELFFIVLALGVGMIIPLTFILMRSQASTSLIIMPLMVFCFIIVGVVSMVVLLSSEEDGRASEAESRPSSQRRRQGRKVDNWETERSESISWVPPRQSRTKHYCTNCGTLLDYEDNFCQQRGWEIRTKSYDRR